MTRTFYVDAALSITNKENKRYWKCSVVENGINIANFANSVVNIKEKSKKDGKFYQVGTNAAEAFTILKVVFLLVEQKWEGKVNIFTDSRTCISIFEAMARGHQRKNMKGAKYLKLAHEIATQKKIKVKLKWVKGTENPADYYSRNPTKIIKNV